MESLDELILRKRRDILVSRVSAPESFLYESLFHYQAPPPIPGVAAPQAHYYAQPQQAPQAHNVPQMPHQAQNAAPVPDTLNPTTTTNSRNRSRANLNVTLNNLDEYEKVNLQKFLSRRGTIDEYSEIKRFETDERLETALAKREESNRYDRAQTVFNARAS
jgi:hypothetical protein